MTEISHIQHHFGDYLFNFIKSRVSSYEDAQDIYQEVLLRIMKNSAQLNKSQSLKSWLFTIAKNQIIDYYRTRRFSEDIDNLQSNGLISGEEPEAYQELESCLHGFIDALPPDYKKIVLLSEIEGKSQKEIAESLGINYITLRSKVQRGREKIKKMIFDACIIGQDSVGGFAECTPKGLPASCGTNSECGCGEG